MGMKPKTSPGSFLVLRGCWINCQPRQPGDIVELADPQTIADLIAAERIKPANELTRRRLHQRAIVEWTKGQPPEPDPERDPWRLVGTMKF